MPIVLKGIIHLLLIVVIVWIARFVIGHVKAMKEGFQEGRDEDYEEAAEKLEKEERFNFLKGQVPLVERIALALAGPFRVVQVESGPETIPLYQIGHLDKEKREVLKEALKRDFGFPNVGRGKPISIQMMELLSDLEERGWGELLLRSVQLHILTASADLGYIQFYDFAEQAAAFIQKMQNRDIHSWKEFADGLLIEEKAAQLNFFGERQWLEYWVSRLLNGKESPWNLSWESVLDFKYVPAQAIALEKQKGSLSNWQGVDGCIASKRIMEDGCKVGNMVRREPVTISDSGWLFLAGDETEEYVANPRHFGIYSLDNICNHDKNVISYLTAPYESVIRRDASNKFQKVESR